MGRARTRVAVKKQKQAKRRVKAKKQVTMSRKKPPKKTNKNKRPSKRLLLPSLGIVGIVTSIDFAGNDLGKAFCVALRKSGWEYDPAQPAGKNGRVILDFREALGAYGPAHHELDDAINDLNESANVKAIVAMGGLATAETVARLSKKPYLVLIGAAPTTFNLDPAGLLRGGVNLGNPKMNNGRNLALVNRFNVQPNKICLIYNDNNKGLSQDEKNAWTANGWPSEPGTKGGSNKTSDFAAAVTSAKAKADAVVISSDPFFTENRNQLVKAVNDPTGKTLFACYPFQIYGTTVPAPAHGRSIWLGPDLPGAYGTLGSKTGLLLHNAAASVGLDPPAAPLGPAPL
jgi:hypothetical protein